MKASKQTLRRHLSDAENSLWDAIEQVYAIGKRDNIHPDFTENDHRDLLEIIDQITAFRKTKKRY